MVKKKKAPRRKRDWRVIVFLILSVIIALTMILAFLLARSISRGVTGPMHALVQGMRDSDLTATLPAEGKDEVAEAASVFNASTRAR